MPLFAIINGQEFNIKNQDEINFDFVIDGDSPNVTFTQEFSLEFVDEVKNSPLSTIDALINDAGALQDINCDITDLSGLSIRGRLLAGSSQSEYSNNPTTYKILWKPYIDDFFEKSLSLPVRSFIDGSEYRTIRYIRNAVPNYLESIIIAYAAYTLTREVINQSIKLVETIKESIPTFIGTGADIGPIIRAIFNIIIQALLLALLIVALNELLKQISENIFQKPKAYYSLNVYDVIKNGCKSLGYEFESEILENKYKDLCFLHNTTEEGQLFSSPTNDPIPNISLLDFINKFAVQFNGKIKPIGKTIKLEPKEFFLDETPLDITITDVYNSGSFKFNTDELAQKISIAYQSPPSDGNFKESRYEVQFESKKVSNEELNINKSIDIQMPYSIGVRKNDITSLERFFNSLFDLFAGLDSRYKVSGGERVGFILLAGDLVPTDIVFMSASGEKMNSNTREVLDAQTIYNDFYENEAPYNNLYYINSGKADQYPLSLQQNFELAINNNVKDSDGKTVHIIKSQYDHIKDISEIEYRRRVNKGDFGYFGSDDFNIKNS